MAEEAHAAVLAQKGLLVELKKDQADPASFAAAQATAVRRPAPSDPQRPMCRACCALSRSQALVKLDRHSPLQLARPPYVRGGTASVHIPG
jgi:hypothetical protein